MNIIKKAYLDKIKETKPGKTFLILTRILVLLGKTFRDRKITILAQSLAYTTIFSLVPFLAIFFAVLGKITENQEVKAKFIDFLSVYMFPGYVTSVIEILENLATDSLVFGAIGFPALFITGVFLYVKVDSSINEIWMSKKESKWFKNSMAFFMTLFLGPMILVLVFSIPTYLQNLPFYKEVIRHAYIDALITQLIPVLVLFMGLFVLYSYIPAVSVKYSAAVRGAITAALFIQVGNFLLSIYLQSFSQLDLFYGSLATIPIFLLWVFLFWLIVLAGAALTFIHHYHYDSGYLNLRGMYNEESLLCSALYVLIYLSQCFEKRNDAPDFDRIQLMLGLNSKRLSFIIETLKRKKIITSFEEGKNKRNSNARYQPGQSPGEIFLQELIPIFYHPKNHFVFNQELNELLQSFDIHPGFQQDDLTLQDLLKKPNLILNSINSANYTQITN